MLGFGSLRSFLFNILNAYRKFNTFIWVSVTPLDVYILRSKSLIFFRLKFIYVGSLTLFGISMFLLATFPSQLGVLILSIPAGIIYSTMLTIPFLLMVKYHGSGSVSICL